MCHQIVYTGWHFARLIFLLQQFLVILHAEPTCHEAVKMVDKVETPCHAQRTLIPGHEGSHIESGLQVHFRQ